MKPNLPKAVTLSLICCAVGIVPTVRAQLTNNSGSVLTDQNLTAASSELENQKSAAIKLRLRARPEEATQNLRLLDEFLVEFPASKARPKMEFEIANISFPQGERLCKEADADELAGDLQKASEKRALAKQYFTALRTIQSRLKPDKAAGVEEWDLRDLQEDVIYSHFLEKDYATVKALAQTTISETKPGGLDWMVAKIYQAIVWRTESPSNLAAAAANLDEVLKYEFKKKPDNDRLLVTAAKWRINIAIAMGEQKPVQEVIQLVRGANCTKNIKTDFLRDYESLLDKKALATK